MRNPYTHEEIHHERPPGRRVWDYGFLVVAALGVLYIFSYVWVWWPVSIHMSNSAQAVGFLYGFLGGYAFVRARSHRLAAEAGANWWIGLLLVPVALWDIASPFVLGDLHPITVALHVLAGLLALALAGFAAWEARREPGAAGGYEAH